MEIADFREPLVIPMPDENTPPPEPTVSNPEIKLNSRSSKCRNWFTKMIDRNGEDYFENRVSSFDVSAGAECIIDEIIKGKVDFIEQSKYIMHPIVMATLISYCKNKVSVVSAQKQALTYLKNDYINRDTITDYQKRCYLDSIDNASAQDIECALDFNSRDYAMYQFLYEHLCCAYYTQSVSPLVNIKSSIDKMWKQFKRRY